MIRGRRRDLGRCDACSYFKDGDYYTKPATNAAVDADGVSYIRTPSNS